MIHIKAANAFRVAAKIALDPDNHGGIPGVLLMPDGSILAANPYSAIRSQGAHDGQLTAPILIQPPCLRGLNRSALSFTVSLEDGTLEEVGARSSKKRLLEAKRVEERDVPQTKGEALTDWLNHKPEQACPQHPFDSIRAGELASVYGLTHGVWAAGLNHRTVTLKNLDEGDTIILATMRP